MVKSVVLWSTRSRVRFSPILTHMCNNMDQKSVACQTGLHEVSRRHTRGESEESIAHR